MTREKLKVEKREITGKQVKKLRREGILPANVYGKDFASTSVQVALASFKDVFSKAHETSLVDLEIGNETLPVLIHNVQIDPKKQEIVHADFYKVNLKEKVTANIPVVGTGEPQAVAEKKGILLHQLLELEVEALPTDLPEKIEVNVEGLRNVDEQILVSDLKLSEGVTVLTESSQIVFRIGELVTKEAEAEAAAEEAAAEEEATTAKTEGESSEGEKPEGEEEKGEQKQDSTEGGENTDKQDSPKKE